MLTINAPWGYFSHNTGLWLQFTHSLKWAEWLEDNQRELAKVVHGALGNVALLEIIKVFHLGSKQPPIHSWLKGLICGKKPLTEPVNSKQCLLAALALLQEQRGIVYSLPHWHSKCILTVLSHNQQVAIFMHARAEGKLFMGDWTWGKKMASSKMVYVESNPFL